MSLPGWRAFVAAFLGLLLLAAEAAAGGQTLARSPEVLQGIGRDLVQVKSACRFRAGDDPAWSSAETDDSSWEEVDIGSRLGSQGHWAFEGYGWYRCHLNILSVAGVQQQLAVLFSPFVGPYEVFWDGRLIGRVGSMPPRPIYGFRTAPHTFGLSAGNSVLAVRFWSPPHNFAEAGNRSGFSYAPVIGTAAGITARLGELDHVWLRDKQIYYTVNYTYTLLGILSLIAWLLNRKRRLLFWVGLYAISLPMHVLLFNSHMPMRTGFATGFDNLVTSFREVTLWYLMIYVLELDQNVRLLRWTRRMAFIVVADGLLLVANANADWSGPHVLALQWIDAVGALFLGLDQAFALVIVVAAIGKRLPLAAWLVGISALVLELIGVIAVMSLQGQRFTHFFRVYDAMRIMLFSINGNYFDPQNVMTIVLLASILFAVYRYSSDQSSHQNHLEQELKSAQEVQRILIPETLASPPGFRVTSAYRPAQEVGGDFFQVIAQADGAAMIIVGDVSGKGLKAAMNVSLIVGTVRALAETAVRPGELMERLNHRLYGRLQEGFATCVAARLTPEGECTIANAGHLSPFVREREIELPGSLPLGLVATMEFDEVRFLLAPGEHLTFYTDGLLEARARDGELFGFERVRLLMARNPDAQTALEEAVRFGQDDDITVLSVARLAPA